MSLYLPAIEVNVEQSGAPWILTEVEERAVRGAARRYGTFVEHNGAAYFRTAGRVTANAGWDRAANPGGRVQLDGSASTGEGLTYVWRQTAGTTVTLNNPGSRPWFTSPRTPGLLTFELTVTNRAGVSDSDQVTVLVRSAGKRHHRRRIEGPGRERCSSRLRGAVHRAGGAGAAAGALAGAVAQPRSSAAAYVPERGAPPGGRDRRLRWLQGWG